MKKKIDPKYTGVPNICFSHDVKDKKRKEEFKKQRLTRGFDNSELWNLDYTIMKFIIPRLKAFKKHTNGYPSGLTEKKWDKILDQIIKSFELYISEDKDMLVTENYLEFKKGIDLFSEHFIHLWD